MKHMFDVDVAVQHGLEEAIILENFYYWIKKNEANERHFYDGYYWTYNSQEALSRLFPYLNRNKVQRILQRMEEQGLIIKGNYNLQGYDRTTWYAMTEFAMCKYEQSIVQKCTMHCSDSNNGLFKNEQPIPDINTDNKPNINSCVYSPEFEQFWKVYPRSVNKKGAWNKYKTCLRKGHSSDDLLLAAQEYALECDGNQTEEVYIKHAQTFLGPSEAFVDYIQRAKSKLALEERIRQAKEYAQKQKEEEERKAKELLESGEGKMIWDIIGDGGNE